MYVNINYGNLDAYIEVSFSSIVRYLLDFGTWYYIALRLLQLVLLFEAIFHFVSWLRLRKLIKNSKTDGSCRRVSTAASVLPPESCFARLQSLQSFYLGCICWPADIR